MSQTKRTRWTDVYQSEHPVHARLIASVLDAQGLQVKVERKKPTKQAANSAPFVRVAKPQAEEARQFLARYRLAS